MQICWIFCCVPSVFLPHETTPLEVTTKNPLEDVFFFCTSPSLEFCGRFSAVEPSNKVTSGTMQGQTWIHGNLRGPPKMPLSDPSWFQASKGEGTFRFYPAGSLRCTHGRFVDGCFGCRLAFRPHRFVLDLNQLTPIAVLWRHWKEGYMTLATGPKQTINAWPLQLPSQRSPGKTPGCGESARCHIAVQIRHADCSDPTAAVPKDSNWLGAATNKDAWYCRYCAINLKKWGSVRKRRRSVARKTTWDGAMKPSKNNGRETTWFSRRMFKPSTV